MSIVGSRAGLPPVSTLVGSELKDKEDVNGIMSS